MRTFIAGHRGMVGSAILRKLEEQGAETIVRSRAELDLLDGAAVQRFMHSERPGAVIVAAAKVGGIHANNSYPADFIFENLMIECNVIHSAFEAGIPKLLFLGSSCIYPRDAAQPLVEEALLRGPLEPTNEAYAIAKIAGIKLCDSYNRQYGTDFRSVMPTNLYGPNDQFYSENSHVLPALMARFHDAAREGAKEVEIWGSGKPRREFLHVDDLADACLFVMQIDQARYRDATLSTMGHLNVGSGEKVTIADLADLLREVTGFSGEVTYDSSRPDGTPRKLLDTSRLSSLGWQSTIPLDQGVRQTYEWFRVNAAH